MTVLKNVGVVQKLLGGPWRKFLQWRQRAEITLICRSGLFDEGWYLSQNPDVAAAGIDPVRHYLESGAAEGRDPNPLFDSDWYAEQAQGRSDSRVNPLVHFIRVGAAEGRDPNPLFSLSWFVQQYPEVKRSGSNPLAFYLRYSKYSTGERAVSG